MHCELSELTELQTSHKCDLNNVNSGDEMKAK